MTAPDRIFLSRAWAETFAVQWHTEEAEYLRADGPTVTAYREALRTLGVDPDKLEQEAQK